MTPHPYPFPQVLLDDLAPLCNATFMYRWSWRRDTNNAVFGCPRSCAFAAKFMAAASHVEDFRAPQRFDRRAGAPLTQLPSRLFDPLWLRQNGRNRAGRPDAIPGTSEINAALRPMPFFERGAPTPFHSAFPGALAFHWHGGAGRVLMTEPRGESTTVMGRIERALLDRCRADSQSCGLACPPFG